MNSITPYFTSVVTWDVKSYAKKLLEVDLHIPKQRIKIEEFTGY